MNMAIKLTALLLLVLLLSSCGSKKSPTGGAVDTEKPTVLTTLPAAFGQIANGRILIDFSKPMDKSSITQGIYIYPPVADKKITLDKNTISIRVNEKLRDNTNYYVTLTTRLKDIRGNNLEENQTIIFANGKLNNNRIAGTISYEDPLDKQQSVLLSLLAADSLVVLNQKLTGGAYAIDGLNPDDYILRAYVDKNANGRYDTSTEPWFEARTTVRQATNIDLVMAYADTTLPKISSVQTRSDRELLVSFSETIASYSGLRIARVNDGTILASSVTLLQGDKLHILTAPMDSSGYNITFERITDPKGNISKNALYRFDGNTRKDITPPAVLSTIPRNGTSVNDLEPVLELRFSEIIPRDNLILRLIPSEGGAEIPLRILLADDLVIRVRPARPLQNYRSHTLIVGSDSSDISGNQMGTEHRLVFLPLKRDQ